MEILFSVQCAVNSRLIYIHRREMPFQCSVLSIADLYIQEGDAFSVQSMADLYRREMLFSVQCAISSGLRQEGDAVFSVLSVVDLDSWNSMYS